MKLLLFLDDDPHFNYHIQFQRLSIADRVLKDYDFKFINQENDAYAFLKDHSPDIIFLDLRWHGDQYYGINTILPELQKIVPNVPVIIMTESDQDPDYILEFKEKGIATYFCKKKPQVYEKWKSLTKRWINRDQSNFVRTVDQLWDFRDKSLAILSAVKAQPYYSRLTKNELRKILAYFITYYNRFNHKSDLIPFDIIVRRISELFSTFVGKHIKLSLEEESCRANSLFHQGDLQGAARYYEALWNKNKKDFTISQRLAIIYDLLGSHHEALHWTLITTENYVNEKNFDKALSSARHVISQDRYNYAAHLLKLKAALRTSNMGEELFQTLSLFSEQSSDDQRTSFLRLLNDLKLSIPAIIKHFALLHKTKKIDALEHLLGFCALSEKWDWTLTVINDFIKAKEAPRNIPLLFDLVRGLLSIPIKGIEYAKKVIAVAIDTNPVEAHQKLYELCYSLDPSQSNITGQLLQCANFGTVTDKSLIAEFADLNNLHSLWDMELRAFDRLENLLEDQSKADFYINLIKRFDKDVNKKSEYVLKLIALHRANKAVMEALSVVDSFLSHQPDDLRLQHVKLDILQQLDLKSDALKVVYDIIASLMRSDNNVQLGELIKLASTLGAEEEEIRELVGEETYPSFSEEFLKGKLSGEIVVIGGRKLIQSRKTVEETIKELGLTPFLYIIETRNDLDRNADKIIDHIVRTSNRPIHLWDCVDHSDKFADGLKKRSISPLQPKEKPTYSKEQLRNVILSNVNNLKIKK